MDPSPAKDSLRSPFDNPLWQARLEQSRRELQEHSGFVAELRAESDRGLAIFATSWLDRALADMLVAFMVSDQKAASFIKATTYYTRTNMAYALGLISPAERINCELVGSIRNKFAHRFDLKFSFSEPEIAAICKKLTGPIVDGAPVPHKQGDSPRNIFFSVVAFQYHIWRQRKPEARRTEYTEPQWDLAS
ncbi:hypothetical protein H8B13_05500 [Hymenobacter sp. BT188]|uniref:hypothetical protein n=1 Tax=Hymenobacter sp. BT188 TaxID=2763504 RepID=UPI001651707A|nr:hypothetical protein [Hymenobacter sp. BT188]MBC6606267.1 hypothetical protein [Hymenobacter sp. BT188]